MLQELQCKWSGRVSNFFYSLIALNLAPKLFVPTRCRQVVSCCEQLLRRRECEKWRCRQPEFRLRLERDRQRCPERLPHPLRSGTSDYTPHEFVLAGESFQ